MNTPESDAPRRDENRSYSEQRFAAEVEARTLADVREWITSVHERISRERRAFRSLLLACVGIFCAIAVAVTGSVYTRANTQIQHLRQELEKAGNMNAQLLTQGDETLTRLRTAQKQIALAETYASNVVRDLNTTFAGAAAWSNSLVRVTGDLAKQTERFRELSGRTEQLQNDLRMSEERSRQIEEKHRAILEELEKLLKASKSNERTPSENIGRNLRDAQRFQPEIKRDQQQQK
jgi:chromosome segregation ATPase